MWGSRRTAPWGPLTGRITAGWPADRNLKRICTGKLACGRQSVALCALDPLFRLTLIGLRPTNAPRA